MAIPASEILTQVRALLNDTSGQIFSDAVLFPFIDKAYDDLQEIFDDEDVPTQSERSATLLVAANVVTISLTSTPALPADFLLPVTLWERPGSSAATVLWEIMEMKRWEPNTEKGDTLRYWTFREEEIKLVGATVARDLRIDYRKALTAITTAAITIPVNKAKNYLADRTAQLASMHIGENESRSATCQQSAELSMGRLVSAIIKLRQRTPQRRRRFFPGYHRFR